ncbi:MAG TPA: zinc-dependent alcohol dehydrogenase family protein, partial [Anaerolineales bacterium]|nr:zinc-dependent alcohol dehydrogenase family protein [Anaerolineales bacterium]
VRAQRLAQTGPIDRSPLTMEDLPVPKPGPGEVLLRVRACAVCHTDLHLVEGELQPPRLPVTPGHQVVAEVVGAGAGASIDLGQRVGVPWLGWACGECAFCRRGAENLCPQARFTGFHRDGGFAEFLVADARFALPLPPSFDDASAAPLLCAGIIGYRSLRRAEVEPGDCIGLVGFGASAHLALQVALSWGCRVLVFTRGEAHRRLALRLGAAWAGGIEDTPPDPLDRAILFAPAGDLVPAILERVRPGGTLAINAIHLSPIPAFSYSLLYGERTVRSVANATRQDGRDFLRLAAEIDLQPTVTSYPLEDANRALADLRHGGVEAAAVLLP